MASKQESKVSPTHPPLTTRPRVVNSFIYNNPFPPWQVSIGFLIPKASILWEQIHLMATQPHLIKTFFMK